MVGAGNAGLAAAAITSRSGLKTLLLEKHNLPGGCASSFVRGRFEFETALHELCFVGTEQHPNIIYKMFKDSGADIEWHYDVNLFRVILKGQDGFDVTVRAGRESFLDSIEEAVPGSRESVEALLQLADTNDDAINYVAQKSNKPSKLQMIFKHKNFLTSSSHTLSEIEKQLGIPEKARNIIETYWCYLGVIPDELNAMHFLSMLRSYIDDGAAMPAMRSHELTLALAESIRNNGGEVRYNSKVTHFITDNDRVIGVEVNGKPIYAKEIISNIIPDTAYGMMDKDSVPKGDIKLLNARELAVSAYTIYLGLDLGADELGIKDYSVFVINDKNPKVQLEKHGLYIVNCLNKVIPDCSPKGTCMLFFTILDYGKNLPTGLKSENYQKFKTDFAEKYIRDYEDLMSIDIMSHIEEIEVATPVTFANYLSTPDGAIYGYRLSHWDNILSRILNSHTENSMPGLTFTGGHSTKGDGYSSAYSSGMEVGKNIADRLKGTTR